MLKFAAALAFLGLNFYTYNFLATRPVFPERVEFHQFPQRLGDWVCEREEMASDIIRNLGVTDYMLCNFRKASELVGVYVGYHQSQVREEGGGSSENAIHPPAHCLPGSGWDIIKNEIVELDMPGMPVRPGPVKRLIVARGDARQLTYYWYQSRGRVIAEDWKKVVFVGFDRATVGRTDGSLVRFTVPLTRGGEEAAEAAFQELAPLVLARMADYVPE